MGVDPELDAIIHGSGGFDHVNARETSLLESVSNRFLNVPASVAAG